MAENWRPIAEYPGYEVSNEGHVRALTRMLRIGPSHDGRKQYERLRAGRRMRAGRHSNGYLSVKLPPGRTALIHRLVCRAFNGEPPTPDCHAHHINGIRTDNRAENLRWLEPENNRALRQAARGEEHGGRKLTAHQVTDIRFRLKQSNAGVTGFDTMLAAEYGVSRKTISNIRRGRGWSHLVENGEHA